MRTIFYLVLLNLKWTLSPTACRPPLIGEASVGVSEVAVTSAIKGIGAGVAALSEVRKPGSSTISMGGYTYYWSGCGDGHHLQGVAIAISSRLRPSVVEVIPVDECIMALRLKHAFGFVSPIVVYTPTNVYSLLLWDFARSQRMRISGSWYQCSNPHRWTCNSNTGQGDQIHSCQHSMENPPELQGLPECRVLWH